MITEDGNMFSAHEAAVYMDIDGTIYVTKDDEIYKVNNIVDYDSTQESVILTEVHKTEQEVAREISDISTYANNENEDSCSFRPIFISTIGKRRTHTRIIRILLNQMCILAIPQIRIIGITFVMCLH